MAPGLLLLALAWIDPQAPEATSDPDSLTLRRAAVEAQARFERTRVNHLPWRWGGGHRCDERIGRMCWSHGGDQDWDPPPDPLPVAEARDSLLALLERTAARIPGDAWVAGQRVRYLGESGRWSEAGEVARACALARDEQGEPVPAPRRDPLAGRCHDLLGYVLHRVGDFLGAEEAFRTALGWMSPSDVEVREDPRILVDALGARHLSPGLPPDSLAAVRARFWMLADPLWLVPGNDRWTEHQARHTVAAMRAESRNPHGIPWGSDLTAVMVRYGETIGWQRERGRIGAADDGTVVGHGPNGARTFIPPGDFLADPAGIPGEAWELDPRLPRAIHTPPYAERIALLETQVARFFRPGGALVVAAFHRPEPEPVPSSGGAGPRPRPSPAPDPESRVLRGPGGYPVETPTPEDLPLEAGLVVRSLDGSHEWRDVRVDSPSGGLRVEVPAGDLLVGVEVLDRSAWRGWRYRGGLRVPPFLPDLAGISDLLLLVGDAPEPASVEEALELVLPRPRAPSGGTVTVLWETYGLRPGEPVSFEASLVPAGGGVFRRAAEWLRILDRAPATRVSWEEWETGQGGTLLRTLRLELRGVPAGSYLLRLRATLPGRQVVETLRPLEVVLSDGTPR